MALVAFRPRYKDPFNPLMLESEPLNVSIEQQEYIRDILAKACSDTRFAQKAYAAILIVLTKGSSKTPEITSLNPSSAAIGSENFVLRVIGKDFDEGSVIIWNGSEEITTFVSNTELTTGVNMSTAEFPVDIPVMVQSRDGVLSDVSTFSLTPSVPAASSARK